MTQLDNIEKMLTELVRASRKQRVKQYLESNCNKFKQRTDKEEKVIKNILEFGGDLN